MSSVSLPVVVTSLFLTGLAAFGASTLMSPPPVRSGDSSPIVDPEAWSRTAPVQPGFQARMDAAAQDLNLHGWTPPEAALKAMSRDARSQDESHPLETSISYDSYDSGSYTLEPLEGAGSRDTGSFVIAVLSKADEDRAWATWPNTVGGPQSTDDQTAQLAH